MLVRGKAASAVTSTMGTFKLKNVVPLGQSSPNPGTEIVVANVPHMTLAINDIAYAAYHFTTEANGDTAVGTGTGVANWEVLSISGTASGNGESAKAIAAQNIPAATQISGTNFTSTVGLLETEGSGTSKVGGVVIVEWTDDGYGFKPQIDTFTIGTGTQTGTAFKRRTAVNISKTGIRASTDFPVQLLGELEIVEVTRGTGSGVQHFFDERFVIESIMDLRMLPGFGTGSGALVPYFPAASEAAQLASETCGTGTGT
jgi:hypothetical protein